MLFSERGFSATSIRAIAEKAGCNASLVSHYFGGKEGLLSAIVREGAEAVGHELRLIRTSGLSPGVQLEYFVDFLVDHFTKRRDLIRIVHCQAAQPSSEVFSGSLPVMSENLALIVEIFRELQAAGQLARVDPRVAAGLLMSAVQSYFVVGQRIRALLGVPKDHERERVKAAIKQIFLFGILRGRSRRR